MLGDGRAAAVALGQSRTVTGLANKGRRIMKLGVGIVIGIAIGTAIGTAMNQPAIGVALGVAFGVAIGVFADRARR